MRDFKLLDFYKNLTKEIPLYKHSFGKKNENVENDVENDNVKKPKHYQMVINGVDVQVLDIIRARLTEEEFRGYLKGNVLKYMHRADKKNGLEDYEKCEEYLKKLIKEMEME